MLALAECMYVRVTRVLTIIFAISHNELRAIGVYGDIVGQIELARVGARSTPGFDWRTYNR